ncbi:MAG TPA: 3-deoxy-manno-octulosonate cytidylyltransferase [Bacteroidales bacterium]|nr:3-deoxy-manno-octulosonate cytidylyltransferase [Bacteroidales bacterium]
MKVIGIIPARYASTRFPGKPLCLIGDRTMIRRVYDQAMKCSILDKVCVATDDQRIFEHVAGFGKAIMTGDYHQSGTDRCLEAVNILSEELPLSESDVVINIQGDEPFIQPNQIETLAGLFNLPETEIGTLAKKMLPGDDLANENIVKVVFDNQSIALYFSRWALPFTRGKPFSSWLNEHPYYQHLGMYGYRLEVLKKIAVLSQSSLEKAESLEQLRWLQNGYKIRVGITSHYSIGIDTPGDLKNIPSDLL